MCKTLNQGSATASDPQEVVKRSYVGIYIKEDRYGNELAQWRLIAEGDKEDIVFE